MTSGLLVLATLLLWYRGNPIASSNVNASTIQQPSQLPTEPELGPYHQLSYQQWLTILRREAAAIAQSHPQRLNVLAGDSLSLWFPQEFLPQGVTWLNQGISGETSVGLLRRLKFFDQTEPQIIFVMIGINDLIRGVSEETLVANHREIIRHLKAVHPRATIVVQSILPHGGDRASQRYLKSTLGDPAPGHNPRPAWVKRLPLIPNRQIRNLNQRLSEIAREERVDYLDLHTLFTDKEGDLRDDLSTDGLHLSQQGYTVWRSQLERFNSLRSPTSLSKP
ncbi:MAG: G-D-S-L family lipolytic protein [Leptolyngbyaceae cyanobacterium RU_5_1]|nr:G-D-S-L family lipolytic protein [Leptolyngbyaceae cyanobacterium RU_5_1]